MTTNVTIPSKSLSKLAQYNGYDSIVIRVVVVGEEMLISRESTSQVSFTLCAFLKHEKNSSLLNA